MKILIDIGHPAHVHYFRNLITKLHNEGHKTIIVSRNKDVALNLLKSYKLEYINRGKGGNGAITKILYILKADFLILKIALKSKPDVYISFSTIYPSHIAWLFRKPYIGMTDTEHAKEQHRLFLPFSRIVLTPASFKVELGKKQFRFDSFMELGYLHPKYFTPDKGTLLKVGLQEGERYCILRFVSWKASHDFGENRFTLDDKRYLINKLSEYLRVFISSETELPEDLMKFKLSIPPNKIHDLIAFAAFTYGEGATFASESAMLGTPAIFHNDYFFGTIEEQQHKYSLITQYRISKNGLHDGIQKALSIINENNQAKYKQYALKIYSEKIDMNKLLFWLITNTPESIKTLANNKEIQYEVAQF